jgi:hypothetical protein
MAPLYLKGVSSTLFPVFNDIFRLTGAVHF